MAKPKGGYDYGFKCPVCTADTYTPCYDPKTGETIDPPHQERIDLVRIAKEKRG